MSLYLGKISNFFFTGSVALIFYSLYVVYYGPVPSIDLKQGNLILFYVILLMLFGSIIMWIFNYHTNWKKRGSPRNNKTWFYEIVFVLFLVIFAVSIVSIQDTEQILPIQISQVTELNEWHIQKTKLVNVTVDPAFGSGGCGSLEISSTENAPGSWFYVSSNLINVTPGQTYYLKTHMAWFNTNQSGVLVNAFVNKSYAFQFFSVEIADGSSAFQTFGNEFTVPTNVHYLQIVLFTGWLFKSGIIQKVYYSDFSLFNLLSA